MCDIGHSFLTLVIHLLHESWTCDIGCSCVTWVTHVWHDSLICDMTHSCATWVIHAWHESFMCDIGHSFVTWVMNVWQHDAFMYNMTQSCATLHKQSNLFNLICFTLKKGDALTLKKWDALTLKKWDALTLKKWDALTLEKWVWYTFSTLTLTKFPPPYGGGFTFYTSHVMKRFIPHVHRARPLNAFENGSNLAENRIEYVLLTIWDENSFLFAGNRPRPGFQRLPLNGVREWNSLRNKDKLYQNRK